MRPLLLLTTLSALLTSPAALAQDAAPYDPVQRSQEVLDIIRGFRGLAAEDPVEMGLLSKDELRAVHLEKAFEDQSPEEIRDDARVLAKLDIIPPDFPFVDFILALLDEQVAGFYDPETKELYLIEGDTPEGLDVVLSHELFHAIQDQNYNLLRFLTNTDLPDITSAQLALVEGDASAVMIDFSTPPGSSFSDVPGFPTMIRAASSMPSGMDSEVFDNAPLAIKQDLVFPYVEGLIFVYHLKRHGGWEAVNQVYADPPLSTEQILHPERYIERDPPTWIALPEALSEHRLIGSDTGGEFGTLLFLAQHLQGQPRAVSPRQAAAGWDGDRALSYETPEGDILLINHLLFDSPADALEAFTAHAEVMRLRFPEAAELPIALTGSRGLVFHRAGEQILIEARGAELLHVEGIPAHAGETHAQLARVRNTIWQGRSLTPYPALDALRAEDEGEGADGEALGDREEEKATMEE